MCGILSDERMGPSFVRVTVSSNKSIVSMYIIFTVYMLLHGITIYMYIQYTVAYLLKARTVEPEKQLLPENGSETNGSVKTFPLLGSRFLII
jgi:hypothetical protein